jgi:hypothetical protein
MRRILVLLTVVALMVVMLAMSVAPAFAGWEADGCRTLDENVSTFLSPGAEKDGKFTSDGRICERRWVGGNFVHFAYYDNRDLN